jgi:HNH endonuclease
MGWFQSKLREMLHYDPDTGVWTWLAAPNHNTRLNGTRAGHLRGDGYRQIRIDGRLYYSGRLAWFYMTGQFPREEIDHVNRDPSDDRWNNLREATSSDNKANQCLSSNNTSGYKGVSWNYIVGKWYVHVNGLYLGCFDNLEEAIEARDSFAEEMQGDFAVLNFPRKETL